MNPSEVQEILDRAIKAMENLKEQIVQKTEVIKKLQDKYDVMMFRVLELGFKASEGGISLEDARLDLVRDDPTLMPAYLETLRPGTMQ